MLPMRRGFEGDKVGLGMDGVEVGALMVACVGVTAILWWRLERNALLIKHELERSGSHITRALDTSSIPEIPTLEDIRDELTDLINETIGSMRTPQIADHFGAMAQQWLNFTLQKKMHDIQGSPALENIQKVADVVDDLL